MVASRLPTRALLALSLALSAACASKSDLEALQSELDDLSSQISDLEQTMEDAGTIDVTELEDDVTALQSDYDSLASDLGNVTADLRDMDNEIGDLDARVAMLESLPAELAALEMRVRGLEDAAGNDWWATSGYSGSTLGSSWGEVASVYATTTKEGPIAVWASARGGSTSMRVSIYSTSGSWSDTSEEVPNSMATASVAAVFEPSGPGSYEIALEMYGSSGQAYEYSLVAVQLTEAP